MFRGLDARRKRPVQLVHVVRARLQLRQSGGRVLHRLTQDAANLIFWKHSERARVVAVRLQIVVDECAFECGLRFFERKFRTIGRHEHTSRVACGLMIHPAAFPPSRSLREGTVLRLDNDPDIGDGQKYEETWRNRIQTPLAPCLPALPRGPWANFSVVISSGSWPARSSWGPPHSPGLPLQTSFSGKSALQQPKGATGSPWQRSCRRSRAVVSGGSASSVGS